MRQSVIARVLRGSTRPRGLRWQSAAVSRPTAKVRLLLPTSAVLAVGLSGAGWLLAHPPEDIDEIQASFGHGDPLDVFDSRTLAASTLHYRQASASSLLSSWAVYFACGFPILIDAAPSIVAFMDAFRSNVPILGDAAFGIMKGFLRATFFGKFVAGEDVEGCRHTIDQLGTIKAGGLLSYSAEAEEGQGDMLTHPLNEDIHINMEAIQLASSYPPGVSSGPSVKPTWVALKLTGFLKDPTVLARASAALENSTDYQRGTLTPSRDIFAKHLMLMDSDQKALDALVAELRRMLTVAKSHGVRVDIDAEQSWFQTALDHVVHSLAAEFNTESTVVYNTYQCYRKDTFERMQRAHAMLAQRRAAFGAKLVRGAYMVAERKRAKALGHESPIWDTKSDTNDCFNECALYMSDLIHQDISNARTGQLPRVGVMVGSHNVASTRLVLEDLRRKGLIRNRDDGRITVGNDVRERVVFGQLYSMSDGACLFLISNTALSFYCSLDKCPHIDIGTAGRRREHPPCGYQVPCLWLCRTDAR